MDGYRCEFCGAWVEYRNLSKVLAHEGPLPHVEQDRLAGENGNDCDRKMPPRSHAQRGLVVRVNLKGALSRAHCADAALMNLRRYGT